MEPKQTLLLVEDDATTREVLALLLENEGWRVTSAVSGEDALAILREAADPPQVVLVDQRLPGLRGAAFASALRASLPAAGESEVAVLGMSASSAGEVPGYDAMLRKPFAATEVRAAWQRVRAESASATAFAPDKAEAAAQDLLPAATGDATGSEVPVLDTEVFLNLERQMGTRARELYAFALADAGDRIRHMREAEAGERFCSEAHALKGSCGMIGAKKLAALAARAEVLPEHGVEETLRQEILAAMQRAWDEIHLMLETLFPV